MKASHFRPAARAVQYVALLLLFAGLAWATGTQSRTIDRVLVAQTTSSGTGACDVDGVEVAYASQYAAADHHVASATVRNISATCASGTLVLTLTGASNATLANASTSQAIPSSGPSSVTLTFPNGGPLARDVYNVSVELQGGTTPKPAGCTVPKFDYVRVGELTGDSLIGTNGSDLIYGLDGADTIDAFNGKDCIVGGDGNDTLKGGNQDSFFDGGAGVDSITLGNGNNDVIGGADNDTVRVGNGDNKITAGSGNDTIYMGIGKNTVTAVGTGTTTCILPRSSKTTNAGLAGCTTVQRTP